MRDVMKERNQKKYQPSVHMETTDIKPSKVDLCDDQGRNNQISGERRV